MEVNEHLRSHELFLAEMFATQPVFPDTRAQQIPGRDHTLLMKFEQPDRL